MNDSHITEVHVPIKNAVIRCASDVTPIPIQWLWPDRIALGKLTLIAGDPGLGKSLLCIELAKHVSCGIPWPVDNTQCPCGDVVLLSAEDDMADTIRPRLDAVGANVERVFFLESIQDVNPETGEQFTRSFSLKQDLEAIRQVLIDRPECKLIIIDPISAYIDGTDSHKNSDIRGLLSPIAELAATQKVAIVAITHLNKGSNQNAMYRTTGSLAFVAAARAVFVVARDNDDPDRRLMLPIKNNNGPDNTGFAYRVLQAANNAPVIEWEPETISISADDALLSLPDEVRTEREEAREWLLDLLDTNGGSVLAEEIEKERRKEGLSQITLRRARNDLRKDRIIDKNKSFGTGKWRWYLCAPDNQDVPVSKHEQHEQHDKTVNTYDDRQLAQLAQEKQTGKIMRGHNEPG